MTMDRMNIKITPAIIGTDVLFMIAIGSVFTVPATISTTAATGDTARNRLPESPIGTEIAIGLIPAASANGTINSTMAKIKAVPLPLRITISAVMATRISGRMKSSPFP